MDIDMRTLHTSGLRLLQIYSELADSKEHLLDGLLLGQPPQQWEHYPQDDAIDRESGYQWFYHSHSPEDRPGGAEHGHFHIFARRPLWSRRLQSRAEREFQKLCDSHTRHLLAIGLNAKGVPISVFTVNSWVTGDLMLSRQLTMELLGSLQLNTGHAKLDALIESVVHLCVPEIQKIMGQRDEKLASHPHANKLNDERLELLSELSIDLDAKLQSIL
jgi:hypothetical protein